MMRFDARAALRGLEKKGLNHESTLIDAEKKS
jgi:hypothetical protein